MSKVYRIKERAAFWLNNRYEILEPDGETVLYEISGISFWSTDLKLCEPQGREVLKIRREGFFIHKYHLLSPQDVELGLVTPNYGLFEKSLTLDDRKSQIEIKGSFWTSEFSFLRNEQPIAAASKKTWSWSDSYGLEIFDYESPLLILATVAIIDLVFYEQD